MVETGIHGDFPEGVALVFGGSGGLGRASAILLAERGSNVVVTYKSRREAAENAVAEIKSMGRNAWAVPCDLTDRASVESAVGAAVATGNRIHTVVTAGGLVFDTGPLAEFKQESFRNVIETDVIGFFNVTQVCVPKMREHGGSIVALVTSAIDVTVPTDALSSTPKAAVAMMVKHIATEEAANGIRANAIGPGVIDGGMVIALRETPAKDLLDAAVGATPLGRLGTEREVAEAVTFFASSRASYITGQVVMVDGGLSA